MRAGRRALATAAAALVLATTWPGVARGESPQGHISAVTPVPGALQVQFRAGGLAAGTVIDPKSARVLLDGRDVPISAAPLGGGGSGGQADAAPVPRVVLVVDSSGSMAGDRIAMARAAGHAYLAAVPEGVEVGLVSFSGTARVLTAPSTDHAAVARSLPKLVPDSSGTALYDAVQASLQVLGRGNERRLLILSDGEDTSSGATLAAVADAVEAAGVGLDAVVLGSQPSAVQALTRLTVAGEGRLLQASAGPEATQAFVSAAQEFFAGLAIEVPVPKGMEGASAALEVHATTSTGDEVSAASAVLLPEGIERPGLLANQASLGTGLLALFAGLATALVLAVRARDPHVIGRRRTHEVLATYRLGGPPPAAPSVEGSKLGTSAPTRAALSLVTALCRGRATEQKLAARLERAGVRLAASEWLLLQGAAAALSAVVMSLVVNPLAGLGAALAVAGTGRAWLSREAGKRQAAFVAAIPDALQLVASGLSSGYSFPQALDSVVQEGQDPVASEFGRALAEARLGTPIEAALEAVAQRMASEDFRWVVMAVRAQRDVGGNVADVLHTVCQTMRERQALRRQVQTLAAEGKLSAWMLTALPVVVALFLAVSNPEFFDPMLETAVGIGLLGACAVSLTIGGLWMKKLAKVEM